MFWDGRYQVGRAFASGVYFIHAVAGATQASRKVVVLD